MKWNKHLFILIAGFGLFACKKGKNNPEACNGSSTRREVKLCTDSAAVSIDTLPVSITVSEIGALEVPKIKSEDPRQLVEQALYTITATVHKLSKHRDGDWKVKLTDGNDKFINCESPNTGCSFAKDSPFYSDFITVREWIDAHKDSLVGKTVTITGVAFIDIDHRYPRNAADNELELHPILSISF